MSRAVPKGRVFDVGPNVNHTRVRRNGVVPNREDLRLVLPWILDASQEVNDHLRAFAARYPARFEFKDGKLQQKR